MATRTYTQQPQMNTVPQRRKARTAAEPMDTLVPESVQEKVTAGDSTAKLELALAEVLTGGDVTAAAKTAGVSGRAFKKALRQANCDQYAQRRDVSRLKVINKMYDTVQRAVEGIAKKIADDGEATLADFIQVVDKLGLRLACFENSRTSVVEELAGANDKLNGVRRTRSIIEEVQASGNLTAAQQDVLDTMLSISTLPSGASPAGAGVVVEVKDEDVLH